MSARPSDFDALVQYVYYIPKFDAIAMWRPLGMAVALGPEVPEYVFFKFFNPKWQQDNLVFLGEL